MPTINEIRARLTALDIPGESKQAIEQTKDEIVKLNRERMLSGMLADGERLPNYSFISVNVYGYPPGPWRLKNTGAFQQGINVSVNDKIIVTTSSDSKTEMLKRKVSSKGLDGDAIFGLDKDGRIEYIKELRPVFISNVRGKLKL